MMPAEKVEVKDRTTEELQAKDLIDYLENGKCIQVAYHYVVNREKLGVPYDPPSGLVSPDF